MEPSGGIAATWRATALVGVASGALALGVYVATLSPTLPPGDSGDLITAAATLGLAHPPGYPLFVILGHLFTLLPIGSPAYRVNLMSAVCDAIAVGIVAVFIDCVARDITPADRNTPHRAALALMAGVVGALALAFATQFWSYSLVAEVFALNNFFAATLLLLAFTWYQDPRRRWALWAFFLGSGLAACDQQTIVLLAPGLGTLLLGGIRRVRAAGGRWVSHVTREFAVGVLLLMAGLLPYLYLPISASRHPPLLWGDPSTLSGFLGMVTRSAYGSFSLVAGGVHGTIGENLSAFAGDIVQSFGPVGLLLAALGVLSLARHRPAVGIALVLAFLVSGPLFLAYANPPLSGLLAGVYARFYILPSVPLAALVGTGAFQAGVWVVQLTRRVGRPSLRPVRVAAPAVLGLLLVALTAVPAVARTSSVDQSGNRMTIDFIRDLLSPLDQHAVLLAEGDTSVLGTWYVQNVERFRPDVDVIAVPLLYFQWYIDAERRGHPDVIIPFQADQVMNPPVPVTEKVVSANFHQRPIYYVGVINEAFPVGYGELRTGFARKFVLPSDAGDPFAYVRSHLRALSEYHFPTRPYPSSSWENWESTYYAGAAFDLANAYETVDVTTAERWYRAAINLNPNSPAAYKDLAILLMAHGGQSAEEAALLERYLVLAPQDPQVAAIRATISKLSGAGP